MPRNKDCWLLAGIWIRQEARAKVAGGRGGSAKPVQSYVVTVMAQSGAISHAVSVHVTLD
jgi:hypothetical protein